MNKFTANILLCEKIKEGSECEKFFNYITLEDEHTTNFDIGIFLTADIKEPKNEMFLVNLVYEGDEEHNKGSFHPIGTYEKTFDKKEKKSELIVFKENEIDFRWSGLYTLEFRLCKEIQDINELQIEQLTKTIDESKLINTFSFTVESK